MEPINPAPESADPSDCEPIVHIPEWKESEFSEETIDENEFPDHTDAEKKPPPTTQLAGRSDFGHALVLKHFLISLLDTVHELPRELVVLILQAFMLVNDSFFVFNPFWSDNERVLKEYIQKDRIPFWEISKENIANSGISYTTLQMEVALGSRPRTLRLECDQGDIWIGVAPSHLHCPGRFAPYNSGYGWWVSSKFTTVGNEAMSNLAGPRFVSAQGMLITLLIDAVERTTTWTFHTARDEKAPHSGLKTDYVVVQNIPQVDPTWCVTFCLHNCGDRIVIDTNVAHY